MGFAEEFDLSLVDTCHVEAVDGRMRAYYVFHVRAIRVAPPADAVGGIIVVAEHYAAESDAPEVGVKRFGFRCRLGVDHLQNGFFRRFQAFAACEGRPAEREQEKANKQSFHFSGFKLSLFEDALCEIMQLKSPELPFVAPGAFVEFVVYATAAKVVHGVEVSLVSRVFRTA